jgi:hypothetical protein
MILGADLLVFALHQTSRWALNCVMSLSDLTVADLRQIEKLLSRKQQLQGQIANIDRSLLQLERFSNDRGSGLRGFGHGRPTSLGAAFGGRAVGGGRKGILKAKVIKALKRAGKDGLHVKVLAKKLKVKEPNIRVWFYATGKKIGNIKQIKPATYRWEN